MMRRKSVLTVLAFLLSLSMSGCGSQTEQTAASTTDGQGQHVQEIQNTEVQTNQGTQEMQVIPERQAAQGSDGHILIAYFSQIDIVPEGADAVTHATPEVGNTESVAMEIQNQVGGDLFTIQTVQDYPVSHREGSIIAEEEMRSDARPELSTHVEDMSRYDTVYIGYPIWWHQEPMVIRAFLEEYDFAGKTVIPFCTSMSVGISQSEENIAGLIPDAQLLAGRAFTTGGQDNSEQVSDWLTEIGMK